MPFLKIYVSTSWTNRLQPELIRHLQESGYQVTDFRSQIDGKRPFIWLDVDSNYYQPGMGDPIYYWKPEDARRLLRHPATAAAFKRNLKAIRACDVLILLLPCGRSAHIDFGFANGLKKKTIIYCGKLKPEMCYAHADYIVETQNELDETLKAMEKNIIRQAGRPKGLSERLDELAAEEPEPDTVEEEVTT